MKLYVGSREFKPPGYKTVDIDAANDPDIIADITRMDAVADRCCDEVVASAVLEHIDWPDGFLAFKEFGRVLKYGGVAKISIPDMGLMGRMVASGDSAFHVMGILYGLGGRVNPFERHRYGYTAGMLIDIMELLGFGAFEWWNSPMPDASNGWMPRYEDHHTGLSLNVAGTKQREPLVDPEALYQALLVSPLSDVISVAAAVGLEGGFRTPDAAAPRLYQRLHYQLLDARQRISHLEGELAQAYAAAVSA